MEKVLILHPILEIGRINQFCFVLLPAGGMSYCYASDNVKTNASCHFKFYIFKIDSRSIYPITSLISLLYKELSQINK